MRRNYGRWFVAAAEFLLLARVVGFIWRKNRGSTRLITEVQTRLLPARHVLKTSQPVKIQAFEDFMDVYVRNDDIAIATAPGATTRR